MEDKKIVKTWDSYEAYEKDRDAEFEQRHAKLSTKIKDFFTYSIGWNFRDRWHDIKWFFKNLRKFLKLANEWRPWDYTYQVDLFKFGITELANYMERYGHEVEVVRSKKIQAMRDLVDEIEHDYEGELNERFKDTRHFGDDVKQIVEYEDGSVMFDFNDNKERNEKTKEYYEALSAERMNHYSKIFKLILGKSDRYLQHEVEERYKALPEEEQNDPDWTKRYDIYAELFDGSGIEGWWD